MSDVEVLAESDPDRVLARLTEGRSGRFQAVTRAVQRRQWLFKKLTEWRKEVTTQTELAMTMGTSQPAVVRLERGGADPRMSTLERYAAAMGARIRWRLEVDEEAADSPHLDIAKVRWASKFIGIEDEGDYPERIHRVLPVVQSVLRDREAKEREAARLAARNRTPEDLARLTSAVEALEALPESGFRDHDGLVRFRQAGREFHIAVAAASHDEQLCDEITQMLDELYRSLGRYVPYKSGQKQLHVDIVEAIRNQDPEAAARAVTAHSQNTRDALGTLTLQQLPPVTIMTVLAMREQVERLAAQLAAERRTPQDKHRLNEALHYMRDVPPGGFSHFDQAAAFREADRVLHMAIASAAHDPVVLDLADAVYVHFSDLFSGVDGMDPHLAGLHPKQKGEHTILVNAILEGRPDDAAEATRSHIGSTREAIEAELLAPWDFRAAAALMLAEEPSER